MNDRSFIMPKPAGHRDRILSSASKLFCRQGFHGSSTRDIARAAGVSLGNLYNHFPGKEALFAALLERYEEEYFDPSQPLARAMAAGAFPLRIEEIGSASGEMVRKFGDYIRLIYVDVVEFEGRHIARLFKNMRERYAALLKAQEGALPAGTRYRVDPAVAMMMTTWGYFTYFITEKVFGARGHYGMGDAEFVRAFASVIRHGALESGRIK